MKKIFAANWKLNKSPLEAKKFIQDFLDLAAQTAFFYKDKEVLIFPSAFCLDAVAHVAADTHIEFGPQNIYSERSGAFTGENSGEVAKQMGAKFVLIGHSERRQLFHEVDPGLNAKVKLAQGLQLTPVFCIGETLQQREDGQTESVCFSQLELGLKDVEKTTKLIVAYEPVWAIGTGKVATSQQVTDIHHKLHEKLNYMGYKNVSLLYGGSVKPENATELLKIPHVDGFLVGGAALDPVSFHKICQG